LAEERVIGVVRREDFRSKRLAIEIRKSHSASLQGYRLFMQACQLPDEATTVPVTPFRAAFRPWDSPSRTPEIGDLGYRFRYVLRATRLAQQICPCVTGQGDHVHLAPDAVLQDARVNTQFLNGLADDADLPVGAIAESVAGGIRMLAPDKYGV
jgi:hypothetical protein